MTTEGIPTLERIRDRVRRGQFRLSKHATHQMGVRGRSLQAVQQTILRGEIIREYPEERPYPEFLFLGTPHKQTTPVMWS